MDAPEILTDAAATLALSHAYVGNPVRAARQRCDLSDADAAGGCSDRILTTVAVALRNQREAGCQSRAGAVKALRHSQSI
jgi:hypothetical protein